MNINQACLVSFVTTLAGKQMSVNEIHDLNDLVKACTEPSQIHADAIRRLLEAINEGRLIDAVKEHRAMTGFGLKDSKEEIEKYWPHKAKSC